MSKQLADVTLGVGNPRTVPNAARILSPEAARRLRGERSLILACGQVTAQMTPAEWVHRQCRPCPMAVRPVFVVAMAVVLFAVPVGA